jgi:hypothetical protein
MEFGYLSQRYHVIEQHQANGAEDTWHALNSIGTF